MKIALVVNEKKRRVDVPPMKRLLDTLREDFGLTGTKEGCGEGECGACSVLIDGEVVNSCLVPTCQAEGKAVTTIEGLGRGKDGKRLSALQQSFLDCGGAQCGICTPGMIVAASVLPKRPSLEEIRIGLAGNLCRCTGYTKIYTSVQAALGAPKSELKVKSKVKTKTEKPKTIAARSTTPRKSTRPGKTEGA